MANTATYTGLPALGAVNLTHPDTNVQTPTILSTVVTAPSQNVAGGGAGTGGTRVDALDIVGLGPTTGTTVRLYTVTAGVPTLKCEIPIGAATPNSLTSVIAGNAHNASALASSIPVLPIFLPANASLAVSMQDAQVVHKASLNSLALVQSLGATGNLTLAGTLATIAASAAAVSALQTTAGAAFFTQTAFPFTQANPTQLSITSAGNIGAVTFTVYGTDASGADITETLAGPNANTVFSAKAYSSVAGIFVNAAVGTNTSVGTASAALFAVPTKVTITSPSNNSATNFTITGVSNAGILSTEVLVGPNVAEVTSVNSYKVVTSIKASAATTTVTAGNATALGGFAITAFGGNI